VELVCLLLLRVLNRGVDLVYYFNLLPLHPCNHGGFYLSKHPQKTLKCIQYLALSPTSADNLQPLFTPRCFSNNSTHSKPEISIANPY